MVKKILVFLIFIVVLFISSRSLLYPGFFRTHDFVHGARITEMLRALREGQFPVIWTQHFGYGYGMPLFEFYAPFPFYVGALMYWLTQNLMISVKMLWLLPTVITFWGSYVLGKKLFGYKGGVVTAIAITLAPYRAVDLFVRGAISELWAMMVFPWILYGIVRIFESSKSEKKFDTTSFFITVFSLVVMMISHNLMTMMFFPFIVLFCTCMVVQSLIKKESKEKWLFAIANVFGAIMLAIGLSSFYLFPAVIEKGFTQVESRILSGYFHYSQHFLYIRQFFQENWKYGGSVWGPQDDISFFLGYGQIGLLFFIVLFFSFFVLKKMYARKVKIDVQLLSVVAFLLGALVISLFFTLQKSEFVWNMIAPLQVAQFPWRFLSIATLFLGLLAGAVFSFQLPKMVRSTLFLLSLMVMIIPAWKYFQPESYLEKNEAFYYDNPQRIREEMSEILPDYLPQGLSEALPATAARFYLNDQTQTKFTTLFVSRGHEVLIGTRFTQPTTVIFNVAAYPGWQAYLGNQKTDIQRTEEGLIQIEVPANDQLVALKLEATPVRRVSELISLFSCFVLLWLIIEVKKS